MIIIEQAAGEAAILDRKLRILITDDSKLLRKKLRTELEKLDCEVLEAANDTHTQLMQVEFRTQGRDHPILPALPETQYLKCGIYQVFPV